MEEEKGQAILESACCIVFILFVVWCSTDYFRMLYYQLNYQQYANEYVRDESFEVGEQYLQNVPKGIESIFIKAESRMARKTTGLPMDLEYVTEYEVRSVELKVEVQRLIPPGLLVLYERFAGEESVNGNIILTVKATGVVYDEGNQKQ